MTKRIHNLLSQLNTNLPKMRVIDDGKVGKYEVMALSATFVAIPIMVICLTIIIAR